MNTIGWAILACGVLWDVTMHRKAYGADMKEGSVGVAAFIFVGAIAFMIYSTVAR